MILQECLLFHLYNAITYPSLWGKIFNADSVKIENRKFDFSFVSYSWISKQLQNFCELLYSAAAWIKLIMS